jgi:hypothetical protein
MRNSKSSFFIFLLFAMLLSACENEKNSIPEEKISIPTDEEILGSVIKPQIIDEYIYPILPGTPAWAELKTYAAKVEAVRIPDSVLNVIFTWGLLESCFKYPLYIDYSAFNDQIQYINDLEQTNKGFKELLSRDDAPLVLLYFYRNWDINPSSYFLKRFFIELVIGSDKFVSRLNERQLLYLLSVALDKKEKQNKLYESSTPPYSFYVMANTMIHLGYQPFIKYCATYKKPMPIGNFYWRINSSIEKIEEYARGLLNI